MGCTSLARLISPASDCRTRSGRPVTGFVAQLDRAIAASATRKTLRDGAVGVMAAARWRWIEPMHTLARPHGACERVSVQFEEELARGVVTCARGLNQLGNEQNQNGA